MRIISGKFRGRKLKAPKGLATRPVLARVREALFNVLGDVTDLRVLDLYAGTGAVGIEALSRGAQSLVSVDSGSRQCSVIRENLGALGEEAEVMRAEAAKALKKLHRDGRTFDIIFADPPYERGLASKTIHSIFHSEMLSEKGVVAVTVRHNEELPVEDAGNKLIFNRRYGNTRLAVYKKNP